MAYSTYLGSTSQINVTGGLVGTGSGLNNYGGNGQVLSYQYSTYTTPTVSQPTITYPKVDVGQTETVTATISGGTPNYVGNLLVTNSLPSLTQTIAVTSQSGTSLSSSWTVATNEIGAETANYVLWDSVPTAFNSIPSSSFSVYAAMGSLSTTGAVIDNGQSNTITASWSGGAPNFAVTLFSGSSPSLCSSDTTFVSSASGLTGQTTTFSGIAPSSTTYYCIGITDGSTQVATANQVTPSAITVDAAPTLTSLTPSNSILDLGQSVTYNVILSNGAGPFTVNLMYGTNLISSLTNKWSPNTLTFTAYVPLAISANVFYVVANDLGTTLPYGFNSVTSTIAIYPAMNSIGWTASNTFIDLTQWQKLTSAVSNGAPSYAYTFSIYNALGSCRSQSYVNSVTSNAYFWQTGTGDCGTGWLTANIAIADSATTNFISTNTLSYYVSAWPSAYVATSPILPNSLNLGQNFLIAASVLRGTSGFTYNFIIANAVTNKLIASSGSQSSNTFDWSIPSSAFGNTIEANVIVTDSATTNAIVNSLYASTLTLLNPPTLTIQPALTFISGASGAQAIALPTPSGDGIILYINGVQVASTAYPQTGALIFPLTGLSPGTYTVMAEDSVTGVSSSVTVSVSSSSPGGGGGGGSSSPSTTTIAYLPNVTVTTAPSCRNSSTQNQFNNYLTKAYAAGVVLTINSNSVNLPYSLMLGIALMLLTVSLYVAYYGRNRKYRDYAFAWPLIILIIELVLFLGVSTLVIACG